MSPALVLRLAALVDLVLAACLIATPVLSSRIGAMPTYVIAGALALGAIVIFMISSRFTR